MALQNIQGLVDKNGLSYIGNTLDKYYDSALANLGQRNTNDSSLETVTFTIQEVFENLEDYTDNISNECFLYVIYDNESFYTLNEDKISSDYDINNVEDIQEIIKIVQSENNEEYLKELILPDITDINSLVLNKQLNIIDALFDKINDQEDNQIDRIFIPVNYEFGYMANSINKSLIYHSFKDIYVNVIPNDFDNNSDDYILDSKQYYTGNIFYCKQQNFIKTDVYEYAFNVESEEINCIKKITLPYINENEYWVINNQETNIQAKAHDAINLNIILAYYYKKGNEAKYKFLSGLNSNINPEKISTSQSKIFNIKNGSDIVKCTIKVPTINNDTLTKEDIELNKVLENSTLIIMSKIIDIIESSENINIEKYGDGFVTTLWQYTSTGYECICIDENIALDFNKITNFENLLKYEIKNIEQINPDNFLHRYLVFDQIYQQLKQETNNPIYSYPVLQNLKGSQYNNKYVNNLNFSLKYINYITGEPNKEIKGISKSSDIKYLLNNGSNSNIKNTVTNSLYQYIVNNKINYYNEYVPNYNVPVFDLSEVLVKDSNVINKYNILTFDYDGSMYYSYIGSTQDLPKNILTIGSSNLNINLGENTLTDYNTKKNFKVQDTLNINFSYNYINGQLLVNNNLEVVGDIELNNFEWKKTIIDGVETLSTSFIPHFKYFNFNENIYKELNINGINQQMKDLDKTITDMNNKFTDEQRKEYLYICPILVIRSRQSSMNHYYKYNDLLVLSNLVKLLGLSKITNFISNTNDIINVQSEQGNNYYLVSSNSDLSNLITINNSVETGVVINVTNNNNLNVGNMLYITYIPSSNTLIVNEAQSNKIKSIWKIPTNIN